MQIVWNAHLDSTVNHMACPHPLVHATLVITALVVKTHQLQACMPVAQDTSVTKEVTTRLVAPQETTSHTGDRETAIHVLQVPTVKHSVSQISQAFIDCF